MAIEKRWRGREKFYVLVCDCCGTECGDFDSFQEAVDNKRDCGFRSVNHGGEWSDLCEDCWDDIAKSPYRTAADDFAGL